MSRRRFSKEFKISAVRQLESGKTLAEVARANEIDPSMLYRWHKEWEKDPANAFSGQHEISPKSREAELERTIGRLTMENDFLKRALLRLEAQRAQRSGNGGESCTSKSKPK